MLLVADRYEILAPASVALAFRIPLAHIEGGEVSEGAIDDATRNALTKLSHLHFTPTERARRRVIAMGEEPWRVHRTGAPSLDHLRRSVLLDRAALAARLDFDVTDATVVVAYHPVTLADDTLFEADALFAALQRIDAPVVFCFPNADAGGRRLAERAKSFCDARQRATLFVNLNPVVYWSLLSHCGLMVGNSSSGIMETPALKLPTVNVGMRQQGRERAPNVLDAPADGDAITMAIERARSASFRESLSGMENPYGDGDAAPRIVRVLAEVELDRLLMKKATSVD
jgi:UDP-N-acetylglucosamine 2-epimerase (non-hydrolysing)/GDP/UDP-N,N'-diacetylbacillosamine 2-epimerase (hydrolysing)